MKTKLFIISTVILLILNIIIIVSFYNFRNTSIYAVQSAAKMSKEYSSLHNNLVYSILNDGSSIDAKLQGQDQGTLAWMDMFSNNLSQILICRISERYCSSCVNNAVEVFRNCTKEFDQRKIAYFLDCNEDRVFKKQIHAFSIDKDRAFNVPMFNIDAEYANFPYYMVVDSSHRVLATYFPNKHNNELDSTFICKMYNRIGNDCKIDNRQNNSIKIDLGNFKVGEKHSITYEFNNNGRLILVDKITTSCECVSANIDLNEISMGESINIAIIYKADDIGSYFREVYIWEKDNEKPIIIELRGYAQ